jgi:hypothetical protein
MGDQASERFEKKWAMSAMEFHWEAHKKQCALEDAALEAESKALPDKLQEVTAELAELTRKVGRRRPGRGLPARRGWHEGCCEVATELRWASVPWEASVLSAGRA